MAERTITLDELAAMPEAEQQAILKHPLAKMKGTAVVRKADGSIRYDSDAEPGKYHEKGDENG
jgi:hypothetical protein